MRLSIPATACWLLLPFAALATEQQPFQLEQRFTPEQMHATGLDTLSAPQLALLNRLLSDESAKHEQAHAAAMAAKDAQVAAAAATQTASAAASTTTSLTVATTAPPKNPESSFIGFNDQPIKSRVVGAVSGWSPGTEFKLENGQTWKVLKGTVDIGKTLQSQEVQVIPGVAGRWFLQVDEDLPKARVYRID